MTAALDFEARKSDEGFFRKSETWLDARGKGAWIVVMVLGFIFFWPLGLALLAYMIWSKRMFSKGCAHARAHHRTHAAQHWEAHRMNRRHGFRSSGNTAFDAYKAETLTRLMDEQEQFEAFLERLRAAKDKSEFDQFMEDRADAARHARAEAADEAEDEADSGEPAKS